MNDVSYTCLVLKRLITQYWEAAITNNHQAMYEFSIDISEMAQLLEDQSEALVNERD